LFFNLLLVNMWSFSAALPRHMMAWQWSSPSS
jgi:hypothetical protein